MTAQIKPLRSVWHDRVRPLPMPPTAQACVDSYLDGMDVGERRGHVRGWRTGLGYGLLYGTLLGALCIVAAIHLGMLLS